ncbi:MAG: fibrobacter succinogenes major paralogous domain-containing protein, partial [Bacteroidia bacterium]
DSRNLCPTGWHSPSDAEFTMLTSYLGGEFIAGGKLKETTTLHWQSPNSGATNESGFTALPAGGRNNDGIFPSNDIGYRGNWWSTTQNNTTTAWYRGIENINSSVMRNFYYNTTGFSVRCVKD